MIYSITLAELRMSKLQYRSLIMMLVGILLVACSGKQQGSVKPEATVVREYESGHNIFTEVEAEYAEPSRVDYRYLTREDYLQSLDSVARHLSMMKWTEDVSFSANPELMILLDTLFQHIRDEHFPAEARKEEQWMSEYRSQLCSYYDRHKLGRLDISNFAKADSVLNQGSRLYELSGQETTSSMVIYSDVLSYVERYRAFGILSQVINLCANKQEADLIYQEWNLYMQIQDDMLSIGSDISYLSAWGGTIASIMSSANYNTIQNSRTKMYQSILSILSYGGWEIDGVQLDKAEQILLKSIYVSIDTLSKETEVGFNEDLYRETVADTQFAYKDLSSHLKSWTKFIRHIDEEFTRNRCRHSVELAASNMLMEWIMTPPYMDSVMNCIKDSILTMDTPQDSVLKIRNAEILQLKQEVDSLKKVIGTLRKDEEYGE
jgi:hypothetical protein